MSSVAGPTARPSDIPSDLPSNTPSLAPTVEPTLEIQSFASELFRQEFTVENDRLFTEFEEVLFQGLYASYTEDFATQGTTVDGRIFSSCEFLSQTSVSSRRRYEVRARRMQDVSLIAVDFSMQYTSLYSNVTMYPTFFQLHVNSNLEKIPEQMQLLGLNVSEASITSRIVIRPDPTAEPTATPTLAPTISNAPSMIPSDLPSLSLPATESPSETPSVGMDNRTIGKGSDVVVISASVVVAVAIVLGGLVVYYRKRKKNDRAMQFQNNPAASFNNLRTDSKDAPNLKQPDGTLTKPNAYHVLGPLGAPAASPSLLSQQSLLSAGNSIGGNSKDEVDATHNLADEFDQYKDQNLEKMRAGIEGNLMGFDGMMSQALTRALIDEDETNVDPPDLLGGGAWQFVGMEIEASALGEVTDWLKRNETPSDDDKRLFMQEILNKMVSSVRHGVLGPEEASRSIHECAALLGLALATEIPVTTLIITGMRKTVTADDMIKGFAEFGEISEAAVASNQRGFGILRFKSNQSVDLAINRFRTGEIVVQDVAVQVKILRPGGNNSSSEDDEALSAGVPTGMLS